MIRSNLWYLCKGFGDVRQTQEIADCQAALVQYYSQLQVASAQATAGVLEHLAQFGPS